MNYFRAKHSCVTKFPIFSASNPLLKATLKNPHLSPSNHSNPIISQLKQCSCFEELKLIHATMIKNHTHQDSFFTNHFITTCSTFHQIDYAILVFSQMEDPNVFVYNAMIRAFVQCSSPIQALQFYIKMSKSRAKPTSYTFSSLIKACIQVSAVQFGETIHSQIWKSGFESQLFVQTSLIHLYSNCGKIDECRKVFDEMPERDIVSWTTMISSHVQFGDLNSARRLFEEMPERNTVSWNTLIAGYARTGDVDSAATLFDQMPCKDLVSWTTMISCYSQNKQFREALEVFKGMKTTGVYPDEVTLSTIISACAHLGALELGKEVHFYMMQDGFSVDVYIGSALIDMYAKCGSIERSLLVFFKMKERNLFCWNSMIEGLAVHGCAREALGLFSEMEREKIKPNGVTFVSILSACTHAGLVEEGLRQFSNMSKEYSISPGVEHYGCVIDLLGRAGLLEGALNLIKEMKVEPNAIIWGSLLGGCKIHGNLEIGEIAVKKLMILEPENSGYYVLLINMHAEANRWSEVARFRGMMKVRRVHKKSPGSSWIEMEGKVHEFAACDMSHLLFDEICLLLVELDGQLKSAGYVPDLVFDS